MEEQRTITVIKSEANKKFGYTEEIHFCQDNHPQGGKEYYIKGYEIWEDGHGTKHRTDMVNLRYLKVSKEYGNRLFKLYTEAYGFKKTDSYTFTPTKMDMR